MRFCCLAAALALASCDGSQPVPTATENQHLDEAAEMLDDAPEELANVPGNDLDRPGNATE